MSGDWWEEHLHEVEVPLDLAAGGWQPPPELLVPLDGAYPLDGASPLADAPGAGAPDEPGHDDVFAALENSDDPLLRDLAARLREAGPEQAR